MKPKYTAWSNYFAGKVTIPRKNFSGMKNAKKRILKDDEPPKQTSPKGENQNAEQ